jgi:hypothetical protein
MTMKKDETGPEKETSKNQSYSYSNINITSHETE